MDPVVGQKGGEVDKPPEKLETVNPTNYTSEDPKQNASNHTGSRWNALEPNLASPADAAKNV